VHRGENSGQTRSLPCVLFWAHDKVFFKKRCFIFSECGRGRKLCRASWRKRTTNKIFAVRFISARGKVFLKNDVSFFFEYGRG
jgi:hypothetical protein